MPEISRFYGIIIRLYFKDHNPPHFHAFYGEYQALVNIQTGEIISGSLPLKARLLVEEWRIIYRKEILSCWDALMLSGKFRKIPGLK